MTVTPLPTTNVSLYERTMTLEDGTTLDLEDLVDAVGYAVDLKEYDAMDCNWDEAIQADLQAEADRWNTVLNTLMRLL